MGLITGSIVKYLKIHNIPARTGYNVSTGQRQISEYITNELGIDTILSDRQTLPRGREIDILVPSKSFAIEYDGLYYHGVSAGYSKEMKESHRWKVIESQKLGIHLIRITEYEWFENKELVKSMIKSRLGIINTKIPARKCKLVNVDKSKADSFF